jgi:cytochrome c oxidase assembly protein subunit 15
VTIGNLIGGFVMIALAWQLALAPAAADRRRGALALRAGFGVAVLALLLQIALGGLASAGYAGLACPDLWRCDASGASLRAFDPFLEPTLAGPGIGSVDGALLQRTHRLAAVLVALLVLPLALAAWRRGGRAGALVVLALLAQGALGAGLVAFALPLPLALAHNAASAVLLAACLQLALPPAPDRPA